MRLFELRAVLQNQVMRVDVVRKLTSRMHSTGINGDPTVAERTFNQYAEMVSVGGKSVLELGPGQTPQVLQLAKKAGARRCAAVDTHLYREAAAAQGIEVLAYDGVHLPFADSSFEVIWSSDVLEHVRHPKALLRDCARVLVPGGLFLAHVDLRDHYFLNDEPQWLHCLRYSDAMWWAMTSNRSSFVNRLRMSDWRALFDANGFEMVRLDTHRSEIIAERFARGDIDAWEPLDETDAAVVRFECALRKHPAC